MSGILGQDRLGAFVLGQAGGFALITDRTAADVERAIYLSELWSDGGFLGTAEELAEWHTNLKGAYNASDLNRVENAVAHLARLLRELPLQLQEYAASLGVAWDMFFDVPYEANEYNFAVKTNWAKASIPSPEDMARYLANVAKLRSALAYNTDSLPTTMDNLRWQGANAIEKALEGLNTAINKLRAATTENIDLTAAAWFYSGEIYAGEV